MNTEYVVLDGHSITPEYYTLNKCEDILKEELKTSNLKEIMNKNKKSFDEIVGSSDFIFTCFSLLNSYSMFNANIRAFSINDVIDSVGIGKFVSSYNNFKNESKYGDKYIDVCASAIIYMMASNKYYKRNDYDKLIGKLDYIANKLIMNYVIIRNSFELEQDHLTQKGYL